MKFNVPVDPQRLQVSAEVIDASVNVLHVPTHKQAAYEALRDMIVELELPPGTRLVEMELARRLRVSKTPIREALALLEIDGLIEFAPYRGSSVSWLVARFEAIKGRDAAAAPAAVQSQRVQLGELCRAHLSDQRVRRYFAPE